MNYALAAVNLAAWLNKQESNLAESHGAVVAYIRWKNAGKRNHLPKNSHRHLFARPIPLEARLREVGVLDLAPMANPDYGILLLVDVDRAGLMSRIRECPHCAKWFFAKNSKKEFCSKDCQEKHWHHRQPKTASSRKAKAKYMRDYRATKKKLRQAKADGRKLKRGRR
jgi:hypothetical protein